MKFRRTGAAFLAAALTASSLGIYAFAEEDAAMKQALTYVKERIEIPEKLTKFEYSTLTENSKTGYSFTWTDPETYDSMNVRITGKVIKRVYINKRTDDEYDWSKPSFAKLSEKKLISIAKDYIKKIDPTISPYIKINEDEMNISLYGSQATLSFSRVYNGIPVAGQTGRIVINKNTGELISFSLNWLNGAGFSDSKNAISLEQAQKAYKKLFPAKLMYTLEYQWNEETRKTDIIPHLIYEQEGGGEINAFTGKLSKFEDYDNYRDAADDEADGLAEESTMNAAPASAKGVTFTDAEMEKLEKEGSLIKAEEELDNLKKLGIFYIPGKSEVSSQYCNFNEQLGSYIRNVSFVADARGYKDLSGGIVIPYDYTVDDDVEEYTVYGNFSYNAENGDVISFYCYSNDNGTDMDQKESFDKADGIMKKLLGDKWKADFGELTETYTSKQYRNYDPLTGRPVGEPYISSVSYAADRMANGIICRNEKVSLTLSNSGYVTNYNLRYNPTIKYPEPKNIISASKAYSQFFKNTELSLRYRLAYRYEDKKTVSALVYSAANTMRIDAFTGKRTNYDGSEYIDYNPEISNYTDLENSKYKAVAEKMKKYGIVLMDEKGRLNENEVITALDFANLLNGILSGSYGAYYSSAPDIGIKEEDKLTREKAAVIVVFMRYGNEIAEMTSIFAEKFTDVPKTNKYIGYINISDASGLIKGNGNKFSPNKAYTRGDALMFAYNLLSK